MCRCVCENDLCGELVSRLSAYPKMKEALASLPPKMVCLAEGKLALEVTLEVGDLATRVATVKARIEQAAFTTTSDKKLVLSLYEDYVKRIAGVLQSTLTLAGAEAAELTLPDLPSVEVPEASRLQLADGQLVLCLPEANGRAAGDEGASQIGVVRDEHIELLLVGSDAKLVLDSCSQVVLPWSPPAEGWAAPLQLEVNKFVDLKERILDMHTNVETLTPSGATDKNMDEIATKVEALLATLPDNIKRDVDQFIQMEALRTAVTDVKEKIGDIETAGIENGDTHPAHQMDSTLVERMMAIVDLSELKRCASNTKSQSQQLEALAAQLFRATGAAGERRYASGQWLTVRQPEPDGQWSDACVSINSVPPLHPWNHAPRELPRADFEALWSWWVQTLQVQHSHIADALTGNRLDVLKQCVTINIGFSRASFLALAAGIALKHDHPVLQDKKLLSKLFVAADVNHDVICSAQELADLTSTLNELADLAKSKAKAKAGFDLDSFLAAARGNQLQQAHPILQDTELLTQLFKLADINQDGTCSATEVADLTSTLNELASMADGGIQDACTLSGFLRASHAERCQGGSVDTPAAVLLTGAPAAGKTCIMSQVIVYSLGHGLLPVLVKVQQLQRRLIDEPDAFDKAWNWVDAFLCLEHKDQPAVYRFLRQALLARRVLLLLDGLDEGGAKRGEIERHVTQVLAPQGLVMLCTSRPAGLTDELFAGFRQLQLSPLTKAQQNEALEKRLGVEGARPLLEYLEKEAPIDTHGHRVTSNPLMLSMFASVFELRRGVGMPETIAELYKLASEAMLSRGGGSSPELRKLLQSVFFEAHMSQDREISELLLTEVAGESKEVLDEFYRRATQDKLPLVSLLTAEPLVLQSSHLSFQEYFTARTLCEQGTRDERLPRGPPWQWREHTAWWENTLTIGEGMGVPRPKGMGMDFWKGLLCAAGLLEGGVLDLSQGRLDGNRPMALRAVHAQLPALLELNLWGNTISAGETVAIAGALRVNAVLTNLNLGHTSIGHEGAVTIARALEVNGPLTSINVSYNNIGEIGGLAIAEALKLNSSLTSINVSYNNIGETGASAIAEMLKVNSSLRKLWLSYNSIGEAGATAIGEALKLNGSLMSLDLEHNNIGKQGGAAIAEALNVNSSLMSLSLYANNIVNLGGVAKAESIVIMRRCSRLL